MTWVFFLIALVLVADSLRIRRRISALSRLAPSDVPASSEHRFITAPGVVLDDATRRAASAFARARGVRVLDLIPGDLPAYRAWSFLRTLDPEAYRRDRLGKGRTAGAAILVEASVLERCSSGDPSMASQPPDALAFARLAGKLKRYACTATDIVIAPSLRSTPEQQRAAIIKETLGGLPAALSAAAPLGLFVLGYGVVSARPGGLAALVAYHLQPLFALAGGSLRPRGLMAYALFRELVALWRWGGFVLGRPPAEEIESGRARLRAAREAYRAALDGGLARFFEARMERCPLCASPDLAVHVRAPDHVQQKPGLFTLERCRACGHIFQNPRLTTEGLAFYYRDHYDGLNEALADGMFSGQAAWYLARARSLKGLSEPARWLDVGGAQGHFCCAAREVWPSTRFHALDFSACVEEAERRGWVDAGYHGAFPELAPELANSYDVVSMSHYLEHTRDPRAELAAASTALRDGGLLFIEVPDPTCLFARLLGRFWLSWYQPQHQHMFSLQNLSRLLAERGFTPVCTVRGEAHQPGDLMYGAYAVVDRIAPSPESPWCPDQSPARKLLRVALMLLGVPFMITGRLLDLVLSPLAGRLGASNVYRVVARKGAVSSGGGVEPTSSAA